MQRSYHYDLEPQPLPFSHEDTNQCTISIWIKNLQCLPESASGPLDCSSHTCGDTESSFDPSLFIWRNPSDFMILPTYRWINTIRYGIYDTHIRSPIPMLYHFRENFSYSLEHSFFMHSHQSRCIHHNTLHCTACISDLCVSLSSSWASYSK